MKNKQSYGLLVNQIKEVENETDCDAAVKKKIVSSAQFARN
jgi:hypothetical protein